MFGWFKKEKEQEVASVVAEKSITIDPAIERRLAALERYVVAKQIEGLKCPICGEATVRVKTVGFVPCTNEYLKCKTCDTTIDFFEKNNRASLIRNWIQHYDTIIWATMKTEEFKNKTKEV